MSTCKHLWQPCTLLCSYTPPLLKRSGKPRVKHKHKYELSGYGGMLWKENYVVWIALEPWVNACHCMPLTRVFQIALRGGVEFLPKWGGMGNFTREILTFKSFSKLKTTFGKYWTSRLKSKLAWPVCTKSMKLKMVQVQWLQLKMKFLLGYNIKIVI